ncbi:CopG family transcriptional regulator [Candidatus Woesearchaeota archaeon]|nr:CopG family transcriptional regulator [Candidatus Woesearchaeota archaeon]
MISVFKELDREKTIVSIPAKLAERIKSNIENTDMSSVSEYVTFLLRMILAEKVAIKKSDDAKIKQRLKNLGYL